MKKNMILIIVALAMFMETIDTTVINTAIPAMAKSLHVNPIDLKLALISYLLSLAIFIPISGWIADKYGIKKVFMSAIALFTLGSIVCGCTKNLTELILARIMQGLGGSLTLPIGRLIIIRICERHEIISKMSIVVMIASLGMMLGPLIGGVIAYHFSWRWIFWVNAPIGFLIIALAIKLLPHIPPRPTHALDRIGFVLFGSGLALFTLGLSLISESDLSLIYSVWMIICSCILFIIYRIHSRHKPYPIVNTLLFSIKTFRIAVIGNLIARIGFGGAPFLLPLLFQIGLGYSSQQSGLLLAPIAIGVLLIKPLSLYILRFFGYKRLLLINTTAVAVSLCLFSQVNATTSLVMISVLTGLYGFLIALQYTAMNSLAYANIQETEISSATSIMSTVQQLAQSFGVAITAIIIQILTAPISESSLTLKTFQQTFIIIGLMTLFSNLIFLKLKKEDGYELIKHHQKKPI